MGNKVLVVDDSALMRKVLRQVLSEAGFEVESARSGREGVELVQAFEPDVVTLDINMPEMDGLTALSLLMAARPTPVIMVEAASAEDDRHGGEPLARCAGRSAGLLLLSPLLFAGRPAAEPAGVGSKDTNE